MIIVLAFLILIVIFAICGIYKFINSEISRRIKDEDDNQWLQ